MRTTGLKFLAIIAIFLSGCFDTPTGSTAYTVYFNSNGGSHVSSQEITDGAPVAEPPPPGRNGYLFNGWYSDEQLALRWDFGSDVVSADMTLYAKWNPIADHSVHTVNFNSRGGSSVPPQQISTGALVAQPPAPDLYGHTFDGWYSDEHHTARWDFGGNVVSADMTLYAKWNEVVEQPVHTVIFNSRGGTPVPPRQIRDGGTVEPPPPPVLSLKVFDGWYLDEHLSQRWRFGSDAVTGDITLHAGWAQPIEQQWALTTNSLTDPDGNTYTTVAIGNQLWTVENLRTTKYADGTPIPLVSGQDEWGTLLTAAYCIYDNKSSRYGLLYNWYVVDPLNPREIAPEGWRVPTDLDWMRLSEYLGGAAAAGGKMKSVGELDWKSPNTSATNMSRFTALPGGFRSEQGKFDLIGTYGFWWSSTPNDQLKAYFRCLFNQSSHVLSYSTTKKRAFSVRLVRDIN